MMRFADDFVCAFGHQADAERFERQHSQRLGKFGLAVAPEKTRVLPFYPGTRAEAFEFLGFEFRWVHQCRRILFKWLNRRSQMRSYTWAHFDAMLRRHTIPAPRIVEFHDQPTLF
jgi:hypothetical protein